MTQAFALRRDKHAIGEFTATFQFQGQISAKGFDGVKERLAVRAKELELEAPLPIQVIKVGIGASAPASPAPAIGYRRFAKNGEIAASLVCDDNSIVFAWREYSRWEELSPVLVDTFTDLIAAYTGELQYAHSLRVQYLNEFRATSPDVRSATALFQPGTPWIAPRVLKQDELWHCHVGEFRTVSPQVRYLINVNSDVSTAQFAGQGVPSLYVKVLLLCGCFYDVPNGENRDLKDVNLRAMISDDLNAAHKLERETLKEVISDEYLALIGADKNDY